MFQALVHHHARPEHREAFRAFMDRVIDATRDAPGLREFTAWQPLDDGPLIAISRWDGEEHFRAALPGIMALAPECDPEWSSRDDELFLTRPVASLPVLPGD